MMQPARRALIAAASRLATGAAFGFALWTPGVVAQSAASVEVILAEASPAHSEAADVLRQELGAKFDVQVMALQAWEQADKQSDKRRRPSVRIALGTNALRAALGARDGVPIVAALVPRVAYDRAIRAAPPNDPRTVTGVYLDQPFGRQLNLIRLALPGKSRVAVLTGPDSSDGFGLLQAAARAERLSLQREAVAGERDVYPALRKALEEADALLALPDSAIYNSATIHNVLATAYRAQIPVFGFSPAYVRAGALAAVYSTPRHIARQTAEMVQKQLGAAPNAAWPAPQYPRYFNVSTNTTVERALGLALDDDASLAAKLAKLERE